MKSSGGIGSGRKKLAPTRRVCFYFAARITTPPPPYIMVIGLLEAQISIPEARSLKDKRSVIRSLKDRVTNRMNVSVAEVGHQDAWKFADFAFVTVAAQRDIVDKRLAQLHTMLEADPRYVLLDVRMELL